MGGVKQALSTYFGKRFSFGTPWGKMFKRIIIEEYHLRFNEKMRLAEDLLFLMEYFQHTNNATFIKETGYHYTVNVTSNKWNLNEEEYVNHHVALSSGYDELCSHFQVVDFPWVIGLQRFISYYFMYQLSQAYSLKGYRLFCQTINQTRPRMALKPRSLFDLLQVMLYYKLYLSVFITLRVLKPIKDRLCQR